jgi:Na+-driven multidrug efflux pump
MKAANRVAKNTAILYGKMALTVFISLYATRLVLAALGSKDFGLFSVIGGAIAMLGFLNASMASATQRFMSFAQGEGDMKKINKIFNMSILLHLRIVIIIFLALEVIGYFIFNGVLNIDPSRLYAAKWIYQFMIISTMFSVISVPYDALLNAHENMLFYAILGIIESLLKLAIAVSMAYVNVDKLIYYGTLTALLSITLLIINRIYCHKKYPESKINIKVNYDKKLLKEMTTFAGWSFLGFSSSMIASYGQGIVLNIFFGTIVNAAQGISNQISGQLGVLANTLMKALNPVIAKSEGSGNRELMIKAAMMGSKVSFFLLMFFYVPMLIEMPYIFNLWLKKVPEFTVLFCQLLLIRNLIEQLFLTLYTSIAAVGNIRKYQIYSSILWSLPLLVSYILFKYGFPPYYLYISFITYSILASILNLYFSRINFNLNIPHFLKVVVLRCFLAFLVTFSISLVPLIFLEEGFIRLMVILVISTCSFIMTVWSIGLSHDDRMQLKQILIPFIKKISIKRQSNQAE